MWTTFTTIATITTAAKLNPGHFVPVVPSFDSLWVVSLVGNIARSRAMPPNIIMIIIIIIIIILWSGMPPCAALPEKQKSGLHFMGHLSKI